MSIIFFIILKFEIDKIREKAIGSEEDEARDEGIGDDRFPLLGALFFTTRRDIVVASPDEKKYSNWSSKEERNGEEFSSDSSDLSCNITRRYDDSPESHESHEEECECPIEDSIFGFFLDFFISSWENESEESPCEHEDRNPEDKHFEKSNQIGEKSTENRIIPEKSSENRWPSSYWRLTNKAILLGGREKYLICHSRNIQEKESNERIKYLTLLCLDTILILREHNHVDTNHHEIDQCKPRDDHLRETEDLESKILCCYDRIRHIRIPYSDRDTLDHVTIAVESSSRYWKYPKRGKEGRESENDEKQLFHSVHDRGFRERIKSKLPQVPAWIHQ